MSPTPIPITDPTKLHYEFTGWTVAYEGAFTNPTGMQKTYSIPGNAYGNVTLTANFNSDNINISYIYDGSDEYTNQNSTSVTASKIESGVYGDTIQSAPAPDPSKGGFTFGGWFTEPNGNGIEWVFGTTILSEANGVDALTDSLTLYALWSTKTINIIYDLNSTSATLGSSRITASETAIYGGKIGSTSAAPDGYFAQGNPTLTGYTFQGWYKTVAEANSPYTSVAWLFASDTVITDEDSFTLYAGWIANTYTVSYNANGGTGTMSSDSVTHDQNYSAKSNQFSRSGYTFKNWNTAADGSGTSYNAGSTFTIIGNVTLYAQWNKTEDPPEPKTYTVTYLPGTRGTFTSLTVSGLAYGVATPTAPTVTGQAGWVFTGWSPSRSDTVTADVAYVAQWRQEGLPTREYTVRFVDWDGMLLKTQIVAYEGAATAPASPEREGYEFIGWDRRFDYIIENITVTAQYREIIEKDPDPKDPDPKKPEPRDPDPKDPDPVDPDPDTTIISPFELTQEEVLEKIKEDGVPTLKIGNLEIPLAPGPTMKQYVWALLNLILTIIGIILAIVLLIRAITTRRRNDEEYKYEESEEEKSQKRTRLIWLIASIILSIIGLIVFLLTEDITKLMVLTDRWTIVNAIIFVLELIAYIFAFKNKKDEDDEADAIPATWNS